MIGRVVSTKMKRTAVVLVSTKKMHPLYKKTFSKTKKYFADDLFGAKEGDIVELVKIRPISRKKHWRVSKILGADVVALATVELKEGAQETIAEVLPAEKEEPEIKTNGGQSGEEAEQAVKKAKKTQKTEEKTAEKTMKKGKRVLKA